MSDDDDDNRGQNDNTGRDNKPEHAKANENAPIGSLGTDRIFAPSLGFGTSVNFRQNTAAGEQTRGVQEPQNNLPYAIETGNKDQDDALRKDHNVVTRKEAEGMIGKEAVARLHGEHEPSSNNSGQVETTQKNQQGSAGIFGQGEKPPERPRISQSDYAKAFRAARDQTRSMGQSKGPTPD